jgi:hypothetical protein
MKTQEILKLTLPEINLPHCIRILEAVANDPTLSERPLTVEELREQAKGLKEAFQQSQERIKTTTVGDVLRGWRAKHESYIAVRSSVFKHVHLSILSTFFRRLIFLGMPEEYLESLPSGQIVLDTKTLGEIFAS